MPAPNKTLIPTVQIAPAKGWPAGAKPAAATGLAVTAFATGLDHPRWLYVLPNGDVLVAETNAPPKPDDGKGIKGMVMKPVQKQAGAGVPSANRITLLRDADGDGVAETRTVFLEGAQLAVRHGAGRQRPLRRRHRRDPAFPVQDGRRRSIAAPGVKVADLPAGTDQPPLDQEHHRQPRRHASCTSTVGSNSNAGENGIEEEEGRARDLGGRPARAGSKRLFATGLRNPNGMAWSSRTAARCGRSPTSATSSATTSCPTT